MKQQVVKPAMSSQYWYQNAVFYGLDVRRFQDSNGDGFGDFRGLINRLDYLADLGIDALWLLPFYDSPLRDNGYDVRDYYQIDPRVGSLDDFTELVQAAHQRHIRLIIDLVMNHSSDQHPWFQASRRDAQSRYRKYYLWAASPPKNQTDTAPAFPGEDNQVWTYDPLAKQYYFHHFYQFQPDLHTGNPEVQEEIFKVIDLWLSFGIDGFRFDAAPFMIKPKYGDATKTGDPFLLFREIHHEIESRKPDAVLLGEANVPLDQIDKYFGGGTEMNMLLNFQIGPHILLAFTRGSAEPMRNYMEDLLAPPQGDQWLNFLRNHDELSLQTMPPEQKQAILQAYAPEESTRIYGRGIRRRITPLLSHDGQGMDRPKVELAFSLMFSSPGTPLFMYGDEIGMGDDLALPGRDAVRTPMQWSSAKNAGFSTADQLIAPVIQTGAYGYERVNVTDQQADPDSFWHFIQRLIAARKACPEIGLCPVQLVEPETPDPRILVTSYRSDLDDHPDGTCLLFHNFSEQRLSVTIHPPFKINHPVRVMLGRGEIRKGTQEKITVDLPGLGYLWLHL